MLERLGPAGACALALLAQPASALADALEGDATLCLYPVELPFAAGDDDARRANIQQKLVSALSVASFEVADPSAVRELADRTLIASGGFVDPERVDGTMPGISATKPSWPSGCATSWVAMPSCGRMSSCCARAS